MGSNTILRPLKGKVTSLIPFSTSQNFTAGWVDLGEEIDVRGQSSITLFGVLDINDSTNARIRMLVKNKSAYQTAVDLANDLKSVLTAHLKNTAEHPLADPNVPTVLYANISDTYSLYDLVKNLLDVYAAHNVDSALALPAYHVAQIGSIALVSVVKPVTIEQALTKLEDLRAKLLTHSDSGVAHTVGAALSSTLAGDLEFATTIENVGASVVLMESEYKEFNVDADQNFAIQFGLDKAVYFVQIQIQAGVVGATAGQIDQVFIVVGE